MQAEWLCENNLRNITRGNDGMKLKLFSHYFIYLYYIFSALF